MDVAIQVPAYEEGETVAETLQEIVSQPVPSWANVDVQAWVTPSPADISLCDTWQNAASVDGVDVHEAPSGKLSARNEAHDYAATEGADAIVTWDADAPPMNDHVLRLMLEPLRDHGTVAVNSNPTSPPTIIGLATNGLGAIEDRVRPHMHGQCSSFTAEAWERVGPIPTEVDETDVKTVREVEEFQLYHQFETLGEVVYQREAMVLNDTRRTECRFGVRNDEFCERIGEETFQLDGRRN